MSQDDNYYHICYQENGRVTVDVESFGDEIDADSKANDTMERTTNKIDAYAVVPYWVAEQLIKRGE